MKIAESWLREWIDPDFDTEALGHRLTMLGHEVDSIEFDGKGIADIVVAQVVDVEKHPNADKLSLCKVDDGSGDLLDIVCGAPNVVRGMKAALARPGVTLPDGTRLRKAKIRGVVSTGMLCSATELHLGADADGIMHLPDDAKAGASLADYLQLPDAVIDLDLTPNRGDCFSVLGIARDLAALTGSALRDPSVDEPKMASRDVQAVDRPEPECCPRFAGCLIRGIDASVRTPMWMTERLRRAGLRAISPVVDITNYVMLEYGQPLHAYDAALLKGAIRPRRARAGETVTLLDEKSVELRAGTLVITDDSGPIGLAGIMGGLSTAVSEKTTDVFFEAAFWPQKFMAGRARSYGLHTDASLRFERGVDPEGQARAVRRATALLLEIAGGSAGPLDDQVSRQHLAARPELTLRQAQLSRLLGVNIDSNDVTQILTSLQMAVIKTDEGWRVTPPGFRFDIAREVDLIEEVARIHGYDSIPEDSASARMRLETFTESRVDLDRAADTLIARDYQEVINYSFIDADANERFSGVASELVLSNPISSEMSVMRSSLWPGLVASAASNVARQQERVRLFEISKSFHGELGNHTEVLRIAGLATGAARPEQWASGAENVDFFDIKADVEALLKLACPPNRVEFEGIDHVALQPGQAAGVVRDGEVIGVIGKLHPHLAMQYDLKRAVYVFELDAVKTLASQAPVAGAVSKFPAIRRDIAVIVDRNVSAGQLRRAVAESKPGLIKDVRIFDIYMGDGIEAGRKSVAIGLILQETSRTLTDADADGAMASAIKNLEDQFAAVLRD